MTNRLNIGKTEHLEHTGWPTGAFLIPYLKDVGPYSGFGEYLHSQATKLSPMAAES